MSAIDEVVVVIPANDEERLIGPCLTALDAAIGRTGAVESAVRVRIVVVLDACVDRTADIVALWPSVETVEVGFRNVGKARGAGVERALVSSDTDPSLVWIANTDADTRVPEQWVLRHLAFAREHNDLVVGAIRPDPGDLTPEQYRAWERRAAAEHSSGSTGLRIHGANLGVRAVAYLAVGGFAPIPIGEDVDLVTRMLAHGDHVVSSDTCWVETSARTSGRAPGGYAEYVRAHY